MDRLAVLGGTAAGATAITVAIVRFGTPEAVLGALLVTGVLTGSVSRRFQSEFLDAFAAGALAWAVAVTVVAFGFDGMAAANEFSRSILNVGLLMYLAAVAFSPLPGLCAAAGGGVGARVQYAVRDRLDA
ncbi:hypothetical protein [Halobacterium litoreum]|uniref:Uncharacterized protein n=1 Tax=Halobacterium litoreum TaxID=2039234 RepID=A0ABD5NHZ8_9EURY|nr:hypothetical protein [Halobacterium litoreum]UHH12537.1 hypothetical protein LT972_10260 [Halobacterium litoreum]